MTYLLLALAMQATQQPAPASGTIEAQPAATQTAAVGPYMMLAGQPVRIMPRARLTASPQGAEVLRSLVGRVIPGLALEELLICADGQQNFSGGLVYQALALKGVATISPKLAPAIMARQVSKSPWKVAYSVGVIAVGAAAFLGSSSVVKMGSTITSALLAAHSVGDLIGPAIQGRIPDPSPLLPLLLEPAGTIQISAGGCIEGLILVQFKKGQGVVTGEIQ